jgi:uracil phosphoribosyltransferase
MTELRTKTTPAARVRALIAEISLMVGYEASRTLDLQPVQGLETPLGPFTGWKLGQRVGLAPILRAGIAMTERACPLHSCSRLPSTES